MAFSQFSCSRSTFQPTKPKSNDPRWEEFKDIIYQFYIVDGLTLDNVISLMSAQYGFNATKSQYSTKFNSWDWHKYTTSNFYKGINHGLKKRQLDITEAEVSYEGTKIPLKKLKKELSRYPDDNSHSGDLVRTPEGVIIEPISYEQVETILNQQIEPITCQQIELLSFAQPQTLRPKLPWHNFIEIALSNLTNVVARQAPLGSMKASPSTLNSNGSQSSPHCFFDFTGPSSDDFGFSDFFTAPPRCGPMTSLHLGDITAVEPQPTPSPGTDLTSLRNERIEGDQLLELFSQDLLKFLRRSIMECGTDEASEAVKELIDPTSEVTMLKLTAYLTLLLSNDLLSDHDVFRLITEVKKQKFKFFKWIFDQAMPSARAAAGRLLHGAVKQDAIDFVSEALKSGADVESPSTEEGGFTLLQSALRLGKIRIAELLLRFGANVNVATTSSPSDSRCVGSEAHASGFTCQCQMVGKDSPVALAARSKTCVNLIPKLLDCGATLPSCNVLLNAIVNGASFNTVRRLISEGADPNECSLSKDSKEMTPLSAAAVRCNIEMVDLLLKANANPNGPLRAEFSHLYKRYYIRWRSPLLSVLCKNQWQAEGPCDAIVALLLKHGADPNLSQLEFLKSSEDLDMFAAPDDLDAEHRDSPNLLYPLQAASCHKKPEIVSMLLDSGALINTQYGTPALTVAVLDGRIEIARLLLGARADPNAFGRYSSCPLALEAAVMTQDLEMVDLLVASGADLNKCPAIDGGRTCLQRVAEVGDMDMFDHLVRLGASVLSDVAPTGGISVLQGLIENQNHDYVSWALEAGLSPNQCSEGSRTPLNAAVVNNDRKSLRLLLDAGVNVHEYGPAVDAFVESSEDEDPLDFPNFLGQRNRFDSSQILSPIQWASYMNSVKVAKVLCDAGVDVNQKANTDSGNMALHLAADRGNYAMIRFLVCRGASVNVFSKGRTALSTALRNENLKIIRYLVKCGADLNLPDISQFSNKEPWTPLERVCWLGKIAVVETLLRMGADPNKGHPLRLTLTESVSPFEALIFRRQGKGKSRIAILELLLTYGAKVNQRDDNSDTPLQTAILEGAFGCEYRLVEKDAHVNAAPSKGSRGRTALQAAAAVGDVDMVEYLLTKGAEINAPAAVNNGVTALQAAAINGHLRIAQILLEHGADIDAAASPDNGRTAIDGAAEFGRLDMVQLLLDNYNGPQPVANWVQSAYGAAKMGNQWHVMDLLKSYRPDIFPSGA